MCDQKYVVLLYHDLPKRSHFHDVLELFIHVPKCELTYEESEW